MIQEILAMVYTNAIATSFIDLLYVSLRSFLLGEHLHFPSHSSSQAQSGCSFPTVSTKQPRNNIYDAAIANTQRRLPRTLPPATENEHGYPTDEEVHDGSL
jgi:hypothetical protein